MTARLPASVIDARYNDKRYLGANADWHAGDAPWKAGLIARVLKRHRVSTRRVAEVGCGSGEILVNLMREFPSASMTGYDLSRDAFAICKPKECERLEFRLEDITASTERFDVLLVIDVFEHVEDYLGFLRKLRSRADRFVFHIPLEMHLSALIGNGLMRARETVGHLHYFTFETALAALCDAGYDIVHTEFTPAYAASTAGKPLKQKLAWLPRQLLYGFSPNLLSKTLGGCSLLVLAH